MEKENNLEELKNEKDGKNLDEQLSSSGIIEQYYFIHPTSSFLLRPLCISLKIVDGLVNEPNLRILVLSPTLEDQEAIARTIEAGTLPTHIIEAREINSLKEKTLSSGDLQPTLEKLLEDIYWNGVHILRTLIYISWYAEQMASMRYRCSWLPELGIIRQEWSSPSPHVHNHLLLLTSKSIQSIFK